VEAVLRGHLLYLRVELRPGQDHSIAVDLLDGVSEGDLLFIVRRME
jgi:hypothetical protein